MRLLVGFCLLGLLFASSAALAQPKSTSAAPLTVEEVMAWRRQVWIHVSSRIVAPLAEAIKKKVGSGGPPGKRVVVTMNVRPPGRIVSANITQASDYPEVDRMAVQLILKTNPLPSMPAQLPDNLYPIGVPVNFGDGVFSLDSMVP